MRVYDYGKIKNCLICGSIDGNFDKFIKTTVSGLRNLNNYVVETHPKEIERQERIAKRMTEEHNDGFPHNLNRIIVRATKAQRMKDCGYDLTGTVIIVDGCNGFGGRDLKYYHDKLEMLNKVLSDNNTYVLFLRGNDDPTYFEDSLIDFSNIKTIQDYSVIKLSKFNCLCIGGCVSIDRVWKMEQEKRIGRKIYWENEKMYYNEEDINNIIKNYNIACVVTSSCPSFAYPGMNSFKHSTWASKDKKIIKDATEERIFMDRIYNKIIENNKKPYIWVYSRFKYSSQTMINDILFQSLNPFQFLHFNDTAYSFFKIDFSKMLKENECVADSLDKNEYHPHITFRNPYDGEDGAMLAEEETIDEDPNEEFVEEDDEIEEGINNVVAGENAWQGWQENIQHNMEYEEPPI